MSLVFFFRTTFLLSLIEYEHLIVRLVILISKSKQAIFHQQICLFSTGWFYPAISEICYLYVHKMTLILKNSSINSFTLRSSRRDWFFRRWKRLEWVESRFFDRLKSREARESGAKITRSVRLRGGRRFFGWKNRGSMKSGLTCTIKQSTIVRNA